MAKKRRKSSSKCPEPFNTLIDLAAAATFDYITYKRRQKRGSNRTKIDPYAATGAAWGLGLIDDTEDLLKLGGVLGAMGAFDDTDNHHSRPYKTSSNKYAWRLNCQDGSEYDISPENYETREEYNEAIDDAKESEIVFEYGKHINTTEVEQDNIVMDQIYTVYKVSLLDSGKNDFFVSVDTEYEVGNIVEVSTDDGIASGVVILKEKCTLKQLPKEFKDI